MPQKAAEKILTAIDSTAQLYMNWDYKERLSGITIDLYNKSLKIYVALK
jgi:hypothetical protein